MFLVIASSVLNNLAVKIDALNLVVVEVFLSCLMDFKLCNVLG